MFLVKEVVKKVVNNSNSLIKRLTGLRKIKHSNLS